MNRIKKKIKFNFIFASVVSGFLLAAIIVAIIMGLKDDKIHRYFFIASLIVVFGCLYATPTLWISFILRKQELIVYDLIKDGVNNYETLIEKTGYKVKTIRRCVNYLIKWDYISPFTIEDHSSKELDE